MGQAEEEGGTAQGRGEEGCGGQHGKANLKSSFLC